MKKLQKISLYLSILAFSSVWGWASAAEPLPSENGGELLVLRNGQILEGRITKLKDQYLVDLPDGEIKIRSTEVDFVCRTLEEGYERKHAIIQAGNWRDHLDLARWCQKHKLDSRAAAEIAAAEAISPNNPMIASLKRQMEPETESAAKPEKNIAHEEGISNEELDRMVHGLPPKTVELFTQTVQPVLMNSCATAGCHGPQSTSNLRLFRVSAGESANRRLTQRNLYAVMQFVNRENPAESPLLMLPAAPHGTAKNAIFNEKRLGQYVRIAEWVDGLSTQDLSSPLEMLADRVPKTISGEPPAEVPAPPHLLSREAQKAKPLAAARKKRVQPISEVGEESGEVTQTAYQEPPADFLQANPVRQNPANMHGKVAPTLDTPSRQSTMQKVKRGAPLSKTGSKDPFDPEVFNRRYHKADAPIEGAKPPEKSDQPENPTNEG
jgi:hypothetical protein